jgi:hypothetical protein
VQQLSLLETSLPQDDDHAVWSALDDEKRAIVVSMLARLIARLTSARTNVNLGADVEANHE